MLERALNDVNKKVLKEPQPFFVEVYFHWIYFLFHLGLICEKFTKWLGRWSCSRMHVCSFDRIKFKGRMKNVTKNIFQVKWFARYFISKLACLQFEMFTHSWALVFDLQMCFWCNENRTKHYSQCWFWWKSLANSFMRMKPAWTTRWTCWNSFRTLRQHIFCTKKCSRSEIESRSYFILLCWKKW